MNQTASRSLTSPIRDPLAARLAAEYAGHLDGRQIRHALNEAGALASLTPFPALFLPALAEEKARAAATWSVRQRRIRRTGKILTLTA